MKLAFAVKPAVPVPVAGTDLGVAVHRIYCVGRNYAAHSREMGGDPDRETPFFFCKPWDAVVPGGGRIPFPPATDNLHHEVELVAVLAKGGANIAEARALDCVYGYAVGLDMTRRDVQEVAKKAARPWDMAKGFDHSAPISAIRPVSEIGHPEDAAITLAVNGTMRQNSRLSHMIWSVAETIAYLSRLVELAPGDLIFTGTPDGVQAVKPGDRLDARIEGVGELTVQYA
ncbi:MAG: fumarylacetoacetate hydrolase family protein [Rhodospirillales bacterium]|nr:fumarylacetoacetate hydrolase family protein [Rhodospirillales bacterium]